MSKPASQACNHSMATHCILREGLRMADLAECADLQLQLFKPTVRDDLLVEPAHRHRQVVVLSSVDAPRAPTANKRTHVQLPPFDDGQGIKVGVEE